MRTRIGTDVKSRPAALRAGRRLASPALTLAAGLAASIPVIVATVRAAQAGWIPGADQGIIATRAYDVFTSHPPLVGQYTLAGQLTGKITHSLGPMLFWLLALPARWGGPVSMSWTMGAVNTLAIVASVALARRRGGVLLMLASALAIALMCQSLAAETFHDVWNPSAGLFPFTLLIFLCWSLACGEYRLLPFTIVVASFVVQAHLMYLPPAVGMLAVGLGGLAIRLRRRSTRPASPTRRSLLAWGAVALLAAAFCWSAPVVDELRESPGNMTLVVRAARAPKAKLGASAGWHAIVRAVGLRPWWLHVPHTRWQRKYEVRSRPSDLAVYSCILLLAALAAATLVAARARQWDLVAGNLIGFVLCGALAAVAASTPTPRVLSATLGYTMWWGTQAGMWVWLMLFLSAWRGVRWLLRRDPLRSALRRAAGPRTGRALPSAVGAGACLLALAGIAGAGTAVAGTEKPDEHRSLYRPTAFLATRLERAVPSGTSIELLGNLNIATMPIKPALRYYLVKHGVRPMARGSNLRLGNWYELYNRPYSYVVNVDDGVRRPEPSARLLARVHFTDGFGHQVVSLWIAPHVSPLRSRRVP